MRAALNWLRGVGLALVTFAGMVACPEPELASVAPAPPREPVPSTTAVLPTRELTPGETRPDATRDVVCTLRTKDIRKVTTAQRDSAYARYGWRPGCCQLDHLVPLSLGGANTLANLWPQPFEPVPGAHEKDKLELWLYHEVCAKRWDLHAAQRALATDWFALYRLWSAGVWTR